MKQFFLSVGLLISVLAVAQEGYLTINPATFMYRDDAVPALELIVQKGNLAEAQKRFSKSIKKGNKQKIEVMGQQIQLKHAIWKKSKIKDPIHIYGNFTADNEGTRVLLALSDTNNNFYDLTKEEIGFKAETYLRRLGIELHQTHLLQVKKEETSLLRTLKKEMNNIEKGIAKMKKNIVGAESNISDYSSDIEITTAEQARLAEEIKTTDRKMTSLSLSQKEEFKLLRKEKGNQENMLKKSRKKTEKLRKNIFKEESKIQEWKNDIKNEEIKKILATEKYEAQKAVVDDVNTQVDQASLLLKTIK